MKQNVLNLIKVNAGRLFMFLLLLSFSQIVSAQTKVSGKVVDEKGEAIIGASIVVKGTTAGSITNVDGDFVLNVSNVKDILVVSYVGYKSQEVGLSGRTSIRIQLKEDSELLSEVVVVGYGSQKKVNLTGAVATVGAETFGSKGTTNTPLANLQGALAGVTVTRSSSSPTRSDWKFEIRGKSSMNDAEPLVIVDGVPGGIDNINPDDIESISILKDASAAIYGARAAGGVVLVTTKRGTAQKKTKVTYKGNVTARTPGLAMDYMNMREYMTTFEEAYINDGKAFDADLNIYPRWVVNAYKVQNVVSDPTSPLYTGAFAGMNTWAAYSSGDIHDYGFYDVDWNDELWGTAYSQSHSLQLSGGSDSNTYNLSLGYVNDNSVLQWGDDNLKRYNIRLNNDFKISKRLKLASNISYDRSTKLYPQRKPNEIGGQPAGSPIATENGLPYAWGGQMGNQWFSKLGGDVNEYSNNFMTNFNLTANIAKDLDLVASATMRTNNYNNKWWESKVQWYYLDETKNLVSPSTDKVGVKSAYSVYQNYSAYLDYKKTIKKNDFAAMAGVSYEVDDYKRNETVTLNHLTDIVKTITTGQDYSVAEVATEWALASYFGRLNYAYAGKYLFEVLGRYDGSSRFAPGYRWKGFYGASAGYRLSEESFIKNMGVFDNLKLRASYGTTGNQSGISVYDGVTFLSLSSPSGTTPSQPLFGNDGSASMLSTLTESSMVSTTRTWETVTSSNIGLDFAFLNNRLSGTLEYYWKQNDNMLVAISYPAVLGISAPTANNGSFRSEGWEVSLNWRDKVGELNYAVGFNIGDNVSNLVSMKNASTVVNGFNSWLEGQPYGTYWGYKAAGLITTQEELNTYKAKAGTTNEVIPSNIRIGDMMFEDADNDGSITKSDMVKLGEDMPHYSFGLNFNLNWKGFDLSAFFQGVGKRTVMRTDQTRGPMLAWYQRQNAAWSGKQYSDIGESEYVMSNNLQAYYNQVQKTSDLMPKLSANDVINKYNYLYSSAWYSQLDGKYIRLKNITFGYTLPKKVTTKASIENARIYFTGTDLFEFTKIKDGWDPEASRDTYGGTNGANAYPFTRGFTVGIDLTF